MLLLGAVLWRSILATALVGDVAAVHGQPLNRPPLSWVILNCLGTRCTSNAYLPQTAFR